MWQDPVQVQIHFLTKLFHAQMAHYMFTFRDKKAVFGIPGASIIERANEWLSIFSQ